MLLTVNGVDVRIGGVDVLRGVFLAVASGETIALVGPAGCGKTALLDVISGFLHPDCGHVWLDGREVTGWPPDRIARAGIGRTFQGDPAFTPMTVEDTVRAATLAAHLRPRDARNAVARAVALAGLQRVGRHPVASLDTGARHRVALARAVAAGPSLLLLDEPLAGLRDNDEAEIVTAVRRLRAEGLAMLLAGHSTTRIQTVCTRTAVMADGQIIRDGAPGKMLRA